MDTMSIRTESGPIQCHLNAPDPFRFRMTRNIFIYIPRVHELDPWPGWGRYGLALPGALGAGLGQQRALLSPS